FITFFFQAEDGIRDRNVTGVQTCALPIYRAPVRRVGQRQRADRRAAHPKHGGVQPPVRLPADCAGPRRGLLPRPRAPLGGEAARSEERRVGKEWRAGGWREE